jgi:hypothetical protein
MKKGKYTVFPESTFKTSWDLMLFFFIIVQSIAIPFGICFDMQPKGFYWFCDTFMDVFFMLDIAINFICGYYRKGVLIMDHRSIVMNYLKGWFILDLPASWPYSWFISFEENV